MSQQSAQLVSLVRTQLDQEIVEQLRVLLEEAVRGEVVGLMVAAHYGGDEYSYAGSGSFCLQPKLAVGALRNLGERFFAKP